MYLKLILLSLSLGLVCGGNISGLSVLAGWVRDVTECGLDSHPTDCLEARTARQLHGFNEKFRDEFHIAVVNESQRLAKDLKEETDKELLSLQAENERTRNAIEKSTGESRGLVDEISDFIAYLTGKILSPFTGGRDDASDEDVDYHQKEVVEGRGKKKELKKKNKQLKLLLLLMLFKNKIKMFLSKLQFLVQLKFLGVATINMLANVFRLWIELKKKHKPSKVVFYENAHHQHHYDHEHLFDHDDGGHFGGYPGAHGHFGHHDDEEYGGGPWPWSRSYDKKGSGGQPSDPSRSKPGYSYYYS